MLAAVTLIAAALKRMTQFFFFCISWLLRKSQERNSKDVWWTNFPNRLLRLLERKQQLICQCAFACLLEIWWPSLLCCYIKCACRSAGVVSSFASCIVFSVLALVYAASEDSLLGFPNSHLLIWHADASLQKNPLKRTAQSSVENQTLPQFWCIFLLVKKTIRTRAEL